MGFLEEEGLILKGIFNRFKKRNFNGTGGQTVKNSTYQLATIIVAKVTALFFTIIIARMLLPELFGLYSLAISTIFLVSSFSDLGLGSALITFVSKSLGKNNFTKAKAYFKQLAKFKIYLLIISSIILISLAYFLSEVYYKKPIFFALLAGGLYIPIFGFSVFLENLFKSSNNFKYPLIKEIIVQVSRFVLVPFGIFIFLKFTLSNKTIVAGIVLILVLCYFFGLLFLGLSAKKKLPFLNYKKSPLSKKEKKELWKFIFPLTATALSGIFFGYIDIIMLGYFVSEEFIGYYSAAFSLISSASVIIGFMGMAMFPLFSRLKGKDLERIFLNTTRITLLISLTVSAITFIFTTFIVKLVYGAEYSNTIPLVKIFSIFLLFYPLLAIYEYYLISQEKTKNLAIWLIIATILNVLLNYLFITFGLKYGMLVGVIGSCIATIISRFIYLLGLMWERRKLNKKINSTIIS